MKWTQPRRWSQTDQWSKPVDLFSNIIRSPSDAKDSTKILITHGIFGQSSNWRGIASKLANKCNTDVHLLDMRNHGSSPHTDQMSHELVAKDILRYIQKNSLKKVDLGGRTAMQLAVDNPEALNHLVVVDIAPVHYKNTSQYQNYIDYMKSIDLKKISSRREADEILTTYIPDYALRQFLLTNLVTDSNANLRWKLNFEALETFLPTVTSSIDDRKFFGPTLFVKGDRSDYIREEYKPIISDVFPNSKIKTIEGAGHWVHADNPQDFVDSVVGFLNAS